MQIHSSSRRSHAPTLNRRQFLQGTGGTALLLALAACAPAVAPTAPAPAEAAAPAESAAPQRGGTLRVAVPDDIQLLDPNLVITTADTLVQFAVYDRLARNGEGEPGDPIYPELAESWELNEDATVQTFHLRQGVTFSHGTPFTARDVEFTLRRLMEPGAGFAMAPMLRDIQEIELVDDYTIRLHFVAPNVALAFNLSTVGSAIIPHDRTVEQLTTEPTGTGPYILGEHTPGERIVLRRNETYWDAERAYVDELHLLPIAEPAAQIAALTSDTTDLVYQITQESLPILESAAAVQVHENARGSYPLLVMNATAKPFDDLRVRQAFKHVVDRVGLHAALMQGRGAVGNDQPIPPNNRFWADVPALAYDVDKAKQLLAEAGYADGLEVTLVTADIGGPRVNDVAVAMQEMLKAAGVNLTVDKVTPGSYWSEKWMQVPFFVSWWPVYAEPDAILSQAYTSQAAYNESGWSSPEMDALIAQGRGEIDPAKRAEVYAEVQKVISVEGGVIIPFFAPFLSASQSRVQGYVGGPRVVFQNIWLAQA